jgi:fibronectin-binding autotransporter adhesin
LSGGARNLSGTTVSFASTVAGGANDLTVTGNASVGGAVTNVGNLSVTGTSALAANVTTTGAQSYNGAVALSGTEIALSAASLTTNAALAAGSTNLSVSTDAIAIGGSLTGTGTFGIAAKTASTTIGLGEGSGTLNINTTEAALISGFSNVTIGSATGTGAINSTGPVSFTDNVRLQTGSGAIRISSSFVSNGNLAVSAGSAGITLSDSISTSGTQTYESAVTLAGETNLIATTVRTNSTVTGAGNHLTIEGNANIGGAVSNVGNLTIYGSTTLGGNLSGTGVMTLTQAVTLSGDRMLSADSGFVLSANMGSSSSSNLTLVSSAGGLAGAGNIALSGGTLNISQVGSTEYTGVISGSGSLIKAGAGTLTLGGTNTYTGGTTLSAGTITLNSSGAIGSAGNLTFSGGTLQYSDQNTTDYSARMASTAGQQIRIDTNSKNITFATGMASSGGTLTKLGAGTLTLAGNNTYTGDTTVSAGTLEIGSGTSGSIAGNLVDNAAVTFNRSDALSYSGIISGTGSVTQSGSGSLTLGGSNTYSGTTTVSAGRLVVTNANSLGSTTAGTTVASGATLQLSSNVSLGAEAISISGSGNGSGAIYSDSNTSLAGLVTMTAASTLGSGSGATLNVSGTINGAYLMTATGSGNFSFGAVGNSSAVAGIDITSSKHVNFNAEVNSTANISIVSTGNITINGTMTASGAMVRLDTTGTSTEGSAGKIIASSLALKGTGGNHTLTSSTNNVSTIAADTGRLSYVNADALTVGTVNPTGITATGPVSLSTVTGDLTISQNITTTDTSSSAIVLNAGSGTAAGTSTGGDIKLSGSPTISVGTGGRATFYSGSVSNTTSVAALVSAGNFRYGSNASSANYTTALGSGNYLIYRERPSITLTGAAVTKSYDGTAFDSTVSGGYTCTGCVNSDGSLVLSYTGSAEGAKDPGSYVIAPSSATHAALGYSVTVTNGSLSIGTKSLQLYGTTGLDKVYDGRNSITYAMASGYNTPTGIVSGDDVYIMGAPTYSGSTVGSWNIVQGTVVLGGSNASKYSLVWNNGSGNITAAPLKVRINDDARFTLASDSAGYNGYSISGFVNGENAASALSGTVSISRSNAGVNTAGVHTGVLVSSGSTLAGVNYNISYVSGNYTIVGAGQLKATVDNTITTYGGSSSSYNVSSLQYVADGNVTLSLPVTALGSNQFSHSSVIAGNISFTIGPGGSVLSTSNNTAAGTYQLAATNASISNPLLSKDIVVVGAHTVNPKELTVTSAAGVTKTYDGTLFMGPNLTVGISGKISGDILSASGIGYYASKNVSRDSSGSILSNIAYTISGLRITGADAANYYYTTTDQFSGTNGSINPAPITAVNYINVISKNFDGNRSAKIDLTSGSFEGRVGTDSLYLLSAGGNYVTESPGKNILVKVHGLTMGGPDSGNYYLAVSDAVTTGDINGIDPKAATAELEVVKSYNWNLPIFASAIDRPAVGNLVASTGLKYEMVDSSLQPINVRSANTGNLKAGAIATKISDASLASATPGSATEEGVSATETRSTSTQNSPMTSNARSRESGSGDGSSAGTPLKVLVVEGGIRLPDPNQLSTDRPNFQRRSLPRPDVELMPVPSPEIFLKRSALDNDIPPPP